MGLIENIFYKIGKSQAKKIEKKLAKDPEYQSLDKEIKDIQKDIQKIKDKYKDDENMQKIMSL